MSFILFFLLIPCAIFYRRPNIGIITVFQLIVFLFLSTGLPLWVYFFDAGALLNPYNFDCSLIKTYSKSFEHDLFATFALFLIFTVVLFFHHYLLRKKNQQIHSILAIFIAIVLVISIPVRIELITSDSTHFKEENVRNPVFFTYGKQINCLIGIEDKESILTGDELLQSKFPDADFIMSEEFPLLRKMPEMPGDLTQFFDTTSDGKNPNIVFLLLEGLYNGFTSDIFGHNFMPFFSSFSDSSLYWNNHYSVSKGAQNFVPGLLGGLPHSEKGFSENLVIPHHFSVVNVLHHNDYKGSFFTAQWSWENSLDKFFTQNRVQYIFDADDYPQQTPRVLLGEDKYFWGVSDRFLFDQYFRYKENMKTNSKKSLDIIYSKGIRSPFSVHDAADYEAKMDSLISKETNTENAEHFNVYKPYYQTLLYTDDLLESFFKQYQDIAGYENTIFVITGSNPVPEFPYTVRLTEYQVPLVIWSPLLKSKKRFYHVTTHWDFYHSFAGLMSEKYGLKFPEYTHSMGYSLLNEEIVPSKTVPLMDGDNKIYRMYSPEFIIWDEGNLHKTTKPFVPLEKEILENHKSSLENYRDAYLEYNKNASQSLLPDSLFFGFFNQTIIKELNLDGKLIRTEYNDLIEQMELENDDHYIDITIKNPDVSLEEVFLITEIRNQQDSILQWNSYGIPMQNRDYGIKTTLPQQVDKNNQLRLKVFIWNQSPVPYSYEGIEIRVYKSDQTK
jgi:hypothetical protein